MDIERVVLVFWCTLSFIVGNPVFPQVLVTSSVHHLTLSTTNDHYSILPSPYLSSHYTIALIRVSAPSPFAPSIVPVNVSNGSEKAAMSPVGLTRLICDGGYLFESYPNPNRETHAPEQKGPPIYLVPLASQNLPPVYQIFAARVGMMSNTQKYPASLDFALMLSYKLSNPTAAVPSIQNHNIDKHIEIINQATFDTCTIEFLAPDLQVVQPSRLYQLKGFSDSDSSFDSFMAAVLLGKFPVQSNPDLSLNTDEGAHGDLPLSKDEEYTDSASSLEALKILDLVSVYDSHRDEFVSPQQIAAANENFETDCTFDPTKHGVFLEISERDEIGAAMHVGRVTTIARKTNTVRTARSMVYGAVDGIASPMLEPVAGLIGDMIGGSMAEKASNEMGPGMVDTIQETVPDLVMPKLDQSLTPQLLKTVTARMLEIFPEALSAYVTPLLSQKMYDELTFSIPPILEKEIPRRVIPVVPMIATTRIARSTEHMTIRSITHTTVGALSHTLYFAPLHETFCLACEKHGKFCEHCHFKGDRVYYGLFYAGYYSTYFSDYYGKFYDNVEDQMTVELEDENIKTDELERLYQWEYST